MLLESERNCGLGMDALVIMRTRRPEGRTSSEGHEPSLSRRFAMERGLETEKPSARIPWTCARL